MRSFLVLVPLLAVVPAAACAARGALGQASLVGRCAEGDAACSRRAPQAPLAVGTRFYPEVAATIAGSTTPSLRLASVADDVLAVDGDALVAQRPGAAAVLLTTDDGTVVDFVHVWIAPITAVTLARRDGERLAGALDLTVGEDVTLVPELWNGAQRLAGDGAAAWTASGDEVLAILRDGSSDRRRLRARAPGTTTVTVAVGDARATVDVVVLP